MRKLVSITHVTLDGVMQAPGGPEEDPRGGFAYGGWAMSIGDDLLREALDDVISREFDMLLGRRTYEIFASYWPDRGENPIGRAFNQAVKHVASRSLEELTWEKSERIAGDVPGAVRRLKASDGPEIHIWGSGELLQCLIAEGLIDEHRMWVYPVVLGQGKRLFEPGLPARELTLVDCRATPAGVVLKTYRPGERYQPGTVSADGASEADFD